MSAVIAASGPDAGVPAHYGDPIAEQRALEAGRGVVRMPHRVVTLTGADRRRWLDTLSSQRVRDLAPGDSAELLLLDVHGRVQHAAAMIDDGERTCLITEAAAATDLADFLISMRFMLDVEIEIAPDLAVLGVMGEDAASTIAAQATGPVAVWRDPWPGVTPGGTRYSLVGADDAAHPGSRWSARWLLVDALSVDPLITAGGSAGLTEAGTWAWEALRIAAWRPRLATEVDGKTLPHELDWLRTAVHLDKGCYKGQEGVARTFNLGRPPRRIVFLHLDGSDHLLPEAGAQVGHGERAVGQVTSVARHHDLGPIALAVVKRSVPTAADLAVAGPHGPIAAAQETILAADGYGEGRPAARGPVTPGLRRRD